MFCYFTRSQKNKNSSHFSSKWRRGERNVTIFDTFPGKSVWGNWRKRDTTHFPGKSTWVAKTRDFPGKTTGLFRRLAFSTFSFGYFVYTSGLSWGVVEILTRNSHSRSWLQILTPDRLTPDPDSRSWLQILTRNPDSRSWLEILTRNPNSKSWLEILTRNPNSSSWLEILTRKIGILWLCLAMSGYV